MSKERGKRILLTRSVKKEVFSKVIKFCKPIKKQVDINYIKKCLPWSKSFEHKRMRKTLFKYLDKSRDGFLTLKEIKDGVRIKLKLDEQTIEDDQIAYA